MCPIRRLTPEGAGVTSPLIQLDQVAKAYVLPDGQRCQAVRPTTLNIAQGDTQGLVGRSGAGKSTLLKLFFIGLGGSIYL